MTESNKECYISLQNNDLQPRSPYEISIEQTESASEFFRRNTNSELSPASCWLWSGALAKNRGYGVYWDTAAQQTKLAHRGAWEIARGPIPQGLSVLHRCDNPPCVNPAHLFLGTQLDNIRDMDKKGRRSPHAHTQKGRKFSDDHRAALSAAHRRRHARTRNRVA